MEATHLAFILSWVVIRPCPMRFPLTHHHPSGIEGFTWLPTLLWGCFRQEPLLQGRGASSSLVELLDGSLVPSSGNNRCLFLLNNSVAHKVILKGWFVTVTTAVHLCAWCRVGSQTGRDVGWPRRQAQVDNIYYLLQTRGSSMLFNNCWGKNLAAFWSDKEDQWAGLGWG